MLIDSGKFISGKPGFSKKQADLFFPPDFADDFPVSMQVNLELNNVNLVTSLPCYGLADLY